MKRAFVISLLAVLLPAGARAQAQTPPQQEPPPQEAPPSPKQPPVPEWTGPAPVVNKWAATLYGFAELDAIADSTQSLNDLSGNNALQRRGTYPGDHNRVTFGARNSRIGFKFLSPQFGVARASGAIEADFFGNQPPGAGQTSGGVSESGFFTSPTFRIRHAYAKLETPWVDVLAGQYWELFGWQATFQPATVEIQGVPGEVYSRTPQLRLSHLFKTAPVGVEVAIAALRPPQRDSGLPDGQAGVRVLVNGWKGLHTTGSTGTGVDPLAVGISGAARRYEFPNAAAGPDASIWTNGWGWSLDALIPVIPATIDDRGNGLTLTGSLVRGDGIADVYTQLTAGLSSPSAFGGALPNVDPGLVVKDSSGLLRAAQSRSYIVGAQYYLPPTGSVWVAANYSRVDLFNAGTLAGAANASKTFVKSEWADACLFWDATPAVRFGFEYARFEQTFADYVKTYDNRYQVSAFYLF